MPKSLKYVSNSNKPPKGSERAKPEHKDQACHSCQLYTKLKGDGAAEQGKCLLMTACLVSGQGWCMSYVKKPA